MKKILIVLNIIFVLCYSSCFIFLDNDEIIQPSDSCLNIEKNFINMDVLDDYESMTIVYADKLPFYYETRCRAEITPYVLPLFKSGIKTGDLYQKGEVIEDYTIPFDLRVINILDDEILVENLEQTFLTLSLFPYYKIQKTDNIEFSITYLGKNVFVQNYEMQFDITSGKYVFSIRLINSGFVLNQSNLKVSMTYNEEIQGLFVDKNYVFYDNGNPYVIKVFNISGISYIKRIYVDIIREYHGFYEVNGELNGNNVIIRR